MQKLIFINKSQEYNLWDKMWNERTVSQEIETCEIELAPKLIFLKYLSKNDKIIDGGCGFGKWVIYLYQRGYNIVGIDNTEITISKIKNYDQNIPVRFGNILNLEYPDNYFDAYISMGVIEHFEKGPHKALKEAHRVLKPGGLLFVSTPTVNVFKKVLNKPLLKE